MRRAGVAEVTEPVQWQRLIGGRGGLVIDLPAGTYSDDTQLRLAVCRSIGGDGAFDAETFAKIELTVWPAYALGAGRGTKAASANLRKREVDWFSNFFKSAGQSYIEGGGNGAAMRIQPHVWSCPQPIGAMLLNVLRDSLITHGHPHGFCGAFFHALCLSHTLIHHEVPGPAHWQAFIGLFSDIPHLIAGNATLAASWLPNWESRFGTSLAVSMETMRQEAAGDLHLLDQASKRDRANTYRDCLALLGCQTAKFRGVRVQDGARRRRPGQTI